MRFLPLAPDRGSVGNALQALSAPPTDLRPTTSTKSSDRLQSVLWFVICANGGA
jgi:hypothetical protein